MSRKYQTNVAIVLNNKGEIALERDENGKLSPDDGEAILALMEKLVAEQKTSVSKWAYFCPLHTPDGKPVYETDSNGVPILNKNGKATAKTAPIGDKKARAGREVSILANRFGQPYVAVLPPKETKAEKVTGKRKLA